MRLEEMGRAVSDEAGVPMVLARDDTGAGAIVWTPGRGPHRLPDEAPEVFGDHPHREEVAADILRIVHHESAGDLVLMGWNRWCAMSFKIENGAHGSAGPRETTGCLVMPPEMEPRVPRRVLRAVDLRALVTEVMNPEVAHMSQRGARDREERSTRLRLMTYNVHFCRGMDGRYSTQRIARVIARAAPDVVCLQELDQSRARSGGVDQGLEIARQLEKDFHFHAVAELDDGHFGNAVLSSLPLRWRAAGPLPAVETRLNLVDRGVLWVEVEVDGVPVQVFNTHLSISERERRLQVAEVVGERWLGHPECAGAVVLAGDFNASPESWIARRVETMLRNAVPVGAGGAGQRTWSSRIPVRRIDHVFTSADLGVHAVTVPRTRLSRVASDHLPVVVDLTITRPAPGEEPLGS
jgi:endonuclease/exonuclease/phosphatase family metal-dependent hydrolase